MIYMNLQMVLNTQNNPYLNQAAQKILAKILLPKQILKSKSFDHPYHMKSRVTNPPPPHPPLPARRSRGFRAHFSALENFQLHSECS